MTQDIANTLYEMDNLEVLRGINSNSIDLIATDPPFNTKRNRSGSAGNYVDKWKYGDKGTLPDQWKWNEVHPKWLETIQDGHPALYQVIESTKVVQGEDTAAFLCFLSVRLLEMHRILKDTGSIYLHCDHTADSYIRIAMDAVFGKKNFCNEIVWSYHRWTGATKRFQRMHQIILFYAKDLKLSKFNQLTEPYSEKSKHKGKRHTTVQSDGTMEQMYTDDTSREKALRDVWEISYLNSQANERTGSPDQKPLKLYERIIEASSNKGDIVLDPFCGCATTIIAANKLKRRWIGIDRRKDARYHIITRLMGIPKKERERVQKFATDQDWLEKQMQCYEMHYRTEPPTRTDNQETAAVELPPVFPRDEKYQMDRKEMHRVLVDRFGLRCWGCNFAAPDARYLELDHINPKSGKDDYGQHHIHNRALLCKPCNLEKSDRMTLQQLRRNNEKNGYMKEGTPIDLSEVSQWTYEYLVEFIEENSRQQRIKVDTQLF